MLQLKKKKKKNLCEELLVYVNKVRGMQGILRVQDKLLADGTTVLYIKLYCLIYVKGICEIGMNCFLFTSASGDLVVWYEVLCVWVEKHTAFMCKADFYDQNQ